MDNAKLKSTLPTLSRLLDKVRAPAAPQLPKHLRPQATWPLAVQLALNAGLIITLYNMMIDREEYLSEAGPAIVLVICLMVLISTFINAFRLRRRYATGKPKRFASLNFGMMILAFIFWCASIIVFMS